MFICSLPEKNNTSPEYAYKREAVRKKDERLKLKGWACADCEKVSKKIYLCYLRY